MVSDDVLKAKIKELEAEVADREGDIARFRSELVNVNKQLESLIGGLNQEIKTAQQIQKALVPTEIPNIPGFEFSSKFIPSHYRGGDYFDIFEHDDRARFGVIVAASSGHTMSALLLSVLLKLTGQMEARKGSEPHNVIKLMAEELLPNIQGEETASIFYGLVDRRSFELSYCRVGDTVALAQDFVSGELQLLKKTSGLINKGYKESLKSEKLALNPRDRLIFCTPGVIETKNLDGEEFGQERLFKSILEGERRGVHEMRNQILFKLKEFSGGQEPPRDITVVVCEVKDRVIKLAKQ